MVATTDCDKPRPISSPKVSKPLMEKKRRARINQCLDQLKTLLESHYSSTIRKRKLEKADILELTVRHLKHLQKMQKFSSVAPESEYQTGFRSCVGNVNHYLLTAEQLTGADRWKLSQLTTRLGSGRPEESCSTMDSAVSSVQTQEGTRRRLVPSPTAGHEESSTASCKTYGPTRTNEAPLTASLTHKVTKTASPKIHCEAMNGQLSVWRPW